MKEEDISNLKLYVWTLSDKFNKGIAFAIAETETEARKMVMREQYTSILSRGKLTVSNITKCAYVIEVARWKRTKKEC